MEEGGQGFKKEGESGSLMALTPGLKRAANARKSHERERSQRERRVMTGGDTMSVGEGKRFTGGERLTGGDGAVRERLSALAG